MKRILISILLTGLLISPALSYRGDGMGGHKMSKNLDAAGYNLFTSVGESVTISTNAYVSGYMGIGVAPDSAYSLKAIGRIYGDDLESVDDMIVGDDIQLGNLIQYKGNNNTYIGFPTSASFLMKIDTINMMYVVESATYDYIDFNPNSNDVDIRFRSDISSQTLFIKGATGNIGINTDDPEEGYGLHVASSAKVDDNFVSGTSSSTMYTAHRGTYTTGFNFGADGIHAPAIGDVRMHINNQDQLNMTGAYWRGIAIGNFAIKHSLTTEASPHYSWINDTDTGWGHSTARPNEMQGYANDVEVVNISTTQVTRTATTFLDIGVSSKAYACVEVNYPGTETVDTTTGTVALGKYVTDGVGLSWFTLDGGSTLTYTGSTHKFTLTYPITIDCTSALDHSHYGIFINDVMVAEQDVQAFNANIEQNVTIVAYETLNNGDTINIKAWTDTDTETIEHEHIKGIITQED